MRDDYEVFAVEGFEREFAARGERVLRRQYREERVGVERVMLEAARYSVDAVDCPDSFVSLLKCIKAVLYSAVNPAIVAIKYLQKLLFSSGFFRPEKGELPEKDKCIISADKLCKAVAASRLDELLEITASDEAINSALAIIADKFEKFFYCTLSSARFFTGKKRSV